MSIFSEIKESISSFFNQAITTFGFGRLDENEVNTAVKDYINANPDWVEFAIKNDPALREIDNPTIARKTALEELSTYLGLQAVALHEKAHALYDNNPSQARKLSQRARLATGIEIHPGAKLGTNVFIDHGAGVVIGETAEIGDKVAIYHGVTLGGNGRNIDGRRHPIIGDNVLLNVGATLMGPITVGNHVIIDSNTTIKGNSTIGNNVKIDAGAELLGNIEVEDGAKIGAGAVIISGAKAGDPPLKIGKNAVIDPGVTVQKDVDENTRVSMEVATSSTKIEKETREEKPSPEISYAKVKTHHESKALSA